MRFAIWITALAVISKALSQINLEPPQDNRLLDGPFALVGALPLARITGWTGERLQRRAKTTSTLRKPTSPSASKKVSSSSPTPTAPPLAAAACAPSMVASVTINGTGTLPRPTSFVKRSGQRLNLDGKPFRIVGTNIYWLCHDENLPPVNGLTDTGRIREALAVSVAMGANTIRILSCGSSLGSASSLETDWTRFSPPGSPQWALHDYAIFAAREYGLRVIITLVDNYDTYYGSKYTFLRWRSLSTTNGGNKFYTDAGVVYDFSIYVKALVGHVSTYTNTSWSNDPTIIAWETINEGGAYLGKKGWTSSIAGLIKGLAPSQLVIDGTDGFWNYNNRVSAPGLGVAAVDIVSDHSYPRNIALLKTEIPLATKANKTFLIGEYDWTNGHGGDSLATYLKMVEGSSINGDMIWNIQGRDVRCCNFVTHGDSYSLYYGNTANTAEQKTSILLVAQHYDWAQSALIAASGGLPAAAPAFVRPREAVG